MFPNFLCIGAEKAGTTWLFSNLKKHPEIWIPIKEVHYFDEKEISQSLPIIFSLFSSKYLTTIPYLHRYINNRSAIPYFQTHLRHRIKYYQGQFSHQKELNYQSLLQDIKYFFLYRNNNWYKSLFISDRKDRIIGDMTPAYSILNYESVANIYKIMPNSKIIFIMRNPVQRAWSYALMYFGIQGKSLTSVSKEEFIAHFNSQDSKLRSSYLRTLKIWKTYYPEKQFLIVFFEEIERCPEDLLNRICNFLEVDSSFYSSSNFIKKKINEGRNKINIPQNFAKYLCNIYHDEIKDLNKLFKGYTNEWINYTNDILINSYSNPN